MKTIARQQVSVKLELFSFVGFLLFIALLNIYIPMFNGNFTIYVQLKTEMRQECREQWVSLQPC